MAFRKATREDILNGPIIRTMLRVGGPAVVSSLLFTLYNLADAFWIGRLPVDTSASVMAGIQVSWPFVWFVISFIAGFGGAAVSALVAQHIGADKPDEANLAINQLFTIGVVTSVVLGVLGFAFSSRFLSLLVSDVAVAAQAATYLRVIFLGLPTMIIPGLMIYAFSSTGDTVTPLLVNGSGVILNMILDPLFVLGHAGLPQMGILGAAIATVISQGITTLVFLILFRRGHGGLRLHVPSLRPQWPWIRRALRIGLPAGIGQSSVALGYVVVMAVIGRLDNAAVALAGYGVADRVFGTLFIVTDGLGIGLTTMIGQTLGAGLLDRARKTLNAGLKTLILIVCAEAAFLYFARRPLIALFVPGQAEVIREGARFVELFAAGMPFLSAYFAAEAIYRGAGHTKPMMIVGILRLWVLRIPLSYLLAFPVGWQADGIWLGMSISNVVSGLIAAVLLVSSGWQRSVVEDG
jgi:putative MATE family efflux protein